MPARHALSRPQNCERKAPESGAPVSSIERSFVEKARRNDVSGAKEIIAASHERGHFCGGQALVGRELRWRREVMRDFSAVAACSSAGTEEVTGGGASGV